MGKIVGAFGTSHVLLDRTGREEAADRVFAGMLEIRRRIDELDPDLVVIVSNDHFVNLDLAREIPFAVPAVGTFAPNGDMGLPLVPFNGHPEFASGLVSYANANGFDLSLLREYAACHGIAMPAFLCAPDGKRPIAPIVTNIQMSGGPTAWRCYELGKQLANYIETQRPASERVVVVGAGGLSHWIGVEGMGAVSYDFDHHIFKLFEEGRAEELAHMTNAEILEKAGNGGMEIINWMVMAGATHGKRGKKVYYEAIPEWFTGMSGIEMEL